MERDHLPPGLCVTYVGEDRALFMLPSLVLGGMLWCSINAKRMSE